MLTTNQKGTLAEAKVVACAVEHRVGVSRPIDDERYDLILDLRPRLVRVQCKWGVRRGDVITITCRTNRRGPDGFVTSVYSEDEIDAVAAYCRDLDEYYFPPAELAVARTGVYLRLSPCRNNQAAGVHWARDFELGATLERLKGPIAQLGERRAGSA
jgi:hypothetical protein